VTIRSLVRAAWCGALLLLAAVPAAHAKVRVAASTTDLASIATRVGGDAVEVFAIARAGGDVHRVEVLPSYMVKVARAQLYLKVGLGLDQWADGIIDGSRNTKLTIVDCSRGVAVLDKPTGKVSAAQGDVHPDGNPHYWLDPRNGAVVGRTVAEALAAADPANAARYRANAEAFAKEAQAAYARAKAVADALPSKTLLTYHASWVYLANAFGLEVVSTVEPVPGIPPTARHLGELVALVKSRKVPVLVQEPYFSPDAGRFLTREAGLRVVTASASCEDITPGAYLDHITHVLDGIAGRSEGVVR
jgi:zinc/manganese transport system substrate-binding protein